MSYDPFVGHERNAMQFQLLIGIQYAIYEIFGMVVVIGASFWFLWVSPYFPALPALVALLTCFKHIRRLTKLSGNLQNQLDKIQGGDPI